MFVLSRPMSRQVVAPQLSRFVDRLFDESFDRRAGVLDASSRTPALDVSESDSAYTLAFEVPGATREQLRLTVQGRRVSLETVDATKTDADAAKGSAPRALYRERTAARYARTVSLPAEVDETTSQAKFENGVLTLTLAKKVPSGPTQVRIS